MFLRWFIENKKPLWIIGFHLGMGILSTFTKWIFILYFFTFILTSIPYIFRFKRINSYLTVFLVYLISYEVFARMVKTSPFIPYEVGKYLMFAGLLFGIIMENRKGILGYVMLVLLIPGFFLDLSGRVQFNNLVFNGLGPINICLAIIYFYRHKFTVEGFRTIVRFMIYPLLSVLGYIFIKTPDFDEIQFSLGANFATTGGFGSNQVSTLLGLAMYLIFLFWVNRWKLSGYRMVDLFLVGLFAFQGLLSFSRGGMIGGAIGIAVFAGVVQFAKVSGTRFKLPRVGRLVIFGSGLLLVIFMAANWISEGNLLLRYQGETEGTLAGAREKDLDLITTGRLEVFLEDWRLFQEHPVSGVGVGASRYMRWESQGVNAHVELSRLLSEHGFLGLLNFAFLLLLAFNLLLINRNPVYKAVVIGFYIIGVYSTFHAATRTYVSPLLIGLSMVWVVSLAKKKKPEVKEVAV